MSIKYRITSGLIELENKQPLHVDVFPVRKQIKMKFMFKIFSLCRIVWERLIYR